MSKKLIRRIQLLTLKGGVVVLSILVCLVVLEVAVRIMGLGNPILYYNAAWGGMRPLPDQQAKRLKDSTVTVDANGYRTAIPWKPGALQILYLGDSVVWGGSGVDDRSLFTELAADALRSTGIDVYAMNAGVNATSLVNQSEMFLHANQRVDILVWVFPWGDVYRTFASVGYLWPARYKPRFALVEFVDHCIRIFWVDSFRHKPPQPAPFQPAADPPGYETLFDELKGERIERNIQALRSAVSDARGRGIPAVVGITPYAKKGRLEPLPEEARRLLGELRSQGVTIFDISGVIEETDVDIETLYLDHVHFNSDGHRLLGKALGTILKDLEGSPPVHQENRRQELP